MEELSCYSTFKFVIIVVKNEKGSTKIKEKSQDPQSHAREREFPPSLKIAILFDVYFLMLEQ